MKLTGHRRKVAIGVALVALLLATVTTRMMLGARAELGRAASARSPAQRVRHLRHAIAHYLPANPWTARAVTELRALARRQQTDGKRAEALASWRALRSALLSLRGAYQPFADALPEANRRIVALSGAVDGAARSLTRPAGRARLARRLASPPAPRAGWAAIGLLGFALWVGGALALLLTGLRADAALTRRFYPLSASVAIGLLLFLLGMAQA